MAISIKSLDFLKSRLGKLIGTPMKETLDMNVQTFATTIATYGIASLEGHLIHKITFPVSSSEFWRQQAFYEIMGRYNDLQKKSSLRVDFTCNKNRPMETVLADGLHFLRYRKWDIAVQIATEEIRSSSGRYVLERSFTIFSFGTDKEFVQTFERDMMKARNSSWKLDINSPTLNVYRSYFNGYDVFWDELSPIAKRRLNTIYLDPDVKTKLVDTINTFFANREEYRKCGILWNLKILVHSIPGCGKDSIAKMIASEWNRNLYFVEGVQQGKVIPAAITSPIPKSPIIVISDMDNFPDVINKIDHEKQSNEEKDEKNKKPKGGMVLPADNALFASMLNSLDGLTSGEGKIIFMSTNNIKAFHPTFLRSGRIDLILEIPPVSPYVFRKFTYDFYGKVLPEDIKLKRNDIVVADLQTAAMAMKTSFPEFIDKFVKGSKK